MSREKMLRARDRRRAARIQHVYGSILGAELATWQLALARRISRDFQTRGEPERLYPLH